MKKIYYIILMGGLLVSGCKSFQKTAETDTKKISKTKLFKQLKKHRFNAKTFESRFAISYTDQNQSLSGNGKLRILKDSIIWGSLNFLGIPMVKFYMTPTRVRYYNKINQTYYDGNLDILQKQLGIPINFDNLQNLLIGDLIIPLNPKTTRLDISKKYYALQVPHIYLKSVHITPFYKILSEKLYKSGQGNLDLHYQDYHFFGNENLPTNIYISTIEKKLKLHYKNIVLNKDLHFPFKLPATYTELEF